MSVGCDGGERKSVVEEEAVRRGREPDGEEVVELVAVTKFRKDQLF